MKVDYINSGELKGKVLKIGDILRIIDTIQMVTLCKCGRVYIENLSGENDELLNRLEIDKDEFSQKFYNHLPYGKHPEADNLILLTKSTIYLMEVAEKIKK